MEKEMLEEWGRKADQGEYTSICTKFSFITISLSRIELISLNPKMWWRYTFCFARRRAAEGLPAPIPPNPPGFTLLPSPFANFSLPRGFEGIDLRQEDFEGDYPAMEIFDTREQAYIASERRTKPFRMRPKSIVAKAWERRKRSDK
jgi:hypothetical protein